jgi:hypothetical protein
MEQPTARSLRIALLSIAIVLCGPAYAEPSAQQFTLAGRFVPPGAPRGHEAVFTDAIIWEVPLADVAAIFRLTPGGYDWSHPGLVVNVWVSRGERARVEAFTMAWMYVYRQPAVPYFRTPESGTPAMRLRHDEALVPAHVWRGDPDGADLLRAIRWLHPSPGIEAKLMALRARYDESVSRWLRARDRTQRLRPCCFAS